MDIMSYALAKKYTDQTVASLGASFSYEIVDALPEVGTPGCFYFVPKGESEGNFYDEYLFVNGKFELVGTTEIEFPQVSWNDLTDKPFGYVPGEPPEYSGEEYDIQQLGPLSSYTYQYPIQKFIDGDRFVLEGTIEINEYFQDDDGSGYQETWYKNITQNFYIGQFEDIDENGSIKDTLVVRYEQEDRRMSLSVSDDQQYLLVAFNVNDPAETILNLDFKLYEGGSEAFYRTINREYLPDDLATTWELEEVYENLNEKFNSTFDYDNMPEGYGRKTSQRIRIYESSLSLSHSENADLRYYLINNSDFNLKPFTKYLLYIRDDDDWYAYVSATTDENGVFSSELLWNDEDNWIPFEIRYDTINEESGWYFVIEQMNVTQLTLYKDEIVYTPFDKNFIDISWNDLKDKPFGEEVIKSEEPDVLLYASELINDGGGWYEFISDWKIVPSEDPYLVTLAQTQDYIIRDTGTYFIKLKITGNFEDGYSFEIIEFNNPNGDGYREASNFYFSATEDNKLMLTLDISYPSYGGGYLSIYGSERTFINTIDDKYISENIARVEWVEEQLQNVGGNTGQVSWNDLKNKPFEEIEGFETEHQLDGSGEIEVNIESKYIGTNLYIEYPGNDKYDSKVYSLTIGSTELSSSFFAVIKLPWELTIKSFDINEDGVTYVFSVPSDSTGEVRFTIEGNIKTLDDKYISENIARASSVEALQAEIQELREMVTTLQIALANQE